MCGDSRPIVSGGATFCANETTNGKRKTDQMIAKNDKPGENKEKEILEPSRSTVASTLKQANVLLTRAEVDAWMNERTASDSDLSPSTARSSVEDTTLRTAKRRKRRRLPKTCDSSEREEALPKKMVLRARGPRPSTGHHSGEALTDANHPAPQSSTNMEMRSKTAADLTREVTEAVANITKVASKSKGSFVRVLKDAAATITEAAAQLSARTSTEETRRLQAANAQLQEEVAELLENYCHETAEKVDEKEEAEEE
ncbi:unnamed protein product [Danaus chrysippus]|uniref:(African queen) hypothetical protein n=1 Tax=Danaus chrysippus TaxID=151541 RepID=A0A8J2QVD9_9NEOP|nr:unnamed protein product [Danaus chrysippus]